MRNKRFKRWCGLLQVFVCVFCCLIHAAEPFDEKTPLLEMLPAQTLGVVSEQWREKIKTCLEQEGQVKIFYFPKEGERYSVTYDVSSSNVYAGMLLFGKHQKTVMPLAYVLQQELLRGYVLRPGCPEPSITDTDFSPKHVTLGDYCCPKFFSQALDDCLTQSFPNLAGQGKELPDHDGKALTADMLKHILPKWRYKRFFWQVVREDRAVEVLQERKKQPEMLLIIGGAGMLWGKLTHCLFERLDDTNNRSLLTYKFKSVQGAVAKKYHFSQEKLESCLNYTGKRTKNILLEVIRMHLAQEEHLTVFYCLEGSQRCKIAFNIRGSTMAVPCALGVLTVPFSYFLQQEMLRGYILRPGSPVPSVTDLNFSEKDVPCEHYDQKQFSAVFIDDALIRYLPKLAQDQYFRYFSDDGGELTADIVKGLLSQRKEGQPFLWDIVHEERAVEIIRERKEEVEVLLIIGGVGMLWGRLANCLYADLPPANDCSLFDYKIARVLRDMCTKYPFSPKEYPSC